MSYITVIILGYLVVSLLGSLLVASVMRLGTDRRKCDEPRRVKTKRPRSIRLVAQQAEPR